MFKQCYFFSVCQKIQKTERSSCLCVALWTPLLQTLSLLQCLVTRRSCVSGRISKEENVMLQRERSEEMLTPADPVKSSYFISPPRQMSRLSSSSSVLCMFYFYYLHPVPGGAGSTRGGGEEEVPPGEEAEGAHHRTGGGHQYCGLR